LFDERFSSSASSQQVDASKSGGQQRSVEKQNNEHLRELKRDQSRCACFGCGCGKTCSPKAFAAVDDLNTTYIHAFLFH